MKEKHKHNTQKQKQNTNHDTMNNNTDLRTCSIMANENKHTYKQTRTQTSKHYVLTRDTALERSAGIDKINHAATAKKHQNTNINTKKRLLQKQKKPNQSVNQSINTKEQNRSESSLVPATAATSTSFVTPSYAPPVSLSEGHSRYTIPHRILAVKPKGHTRIHKTQSSMPQPSRL